jgi:DNA-directed RNA polymerase specialized sigma24 family protein
MWKWIGESPNAPVGVLREDMSDEVFEEVSRQYDEGFPGAEPGALARSGLWRHYAGGKRRRRRQAAAGEATTDSEDDEDEGDEEDEPEAEDAEGE